MTYSKPEHVAKILVCAGNEMPAQQVRSPVIDATRGDRRQTSGQYAVGSASAAFPAQREYKLVWLVSCDCNATQDKIAQALVDTQIADTILSCRALSIDGT